MWLVICMFVKSKQNQACTVMYLIKWTSASRGLCSRFPVKVTSKVPEATNIKGGSHTVSSVTDEQAEGREVL